MNPPLLQTLDEFEPVPSKEWSRPNLLPGGDRKQTCLFSEVGSTRMHTITATRTDKTKVNSMNRKIIPYQPHLKEVARKLRQNMTFSEVLLWNKLKRQQMLSYDFDRQRPIDRYIVDFYCKDLCLAIEIDGESHNLPGRDVRDAERQKRLESLGVHFLRFQSQLD